MAISAAEFKAWFFGFAENLDGPPCSTQFERVKSMVAMLDASGGVRPTSGGCGCSGAKAPAEINSVAPPAVHPHEHPAYVGPGSRRVDNEVPHG